MLTYGFLANGGILERCRVKVNLKPIFFISFHATDLSALR
ncbi:hypothetical protein ATN83_4457 [Raoultella ornithinolytica]|nr:hypothetical protein ATN83_4457 [Raoultella ornithinolytica]